MANMGGEKRREKSGLLVKQAYKNNNNNNNNLQEYIYLGLQFPVLIKLFFSIHLV